MGWWVWRRWSPDISSRLALQQFLRSYLVGMFFWFGMGMGCLVWLMIHFVSGGAWGMMIRRPLEAGTRTLYVMWLCFLPLLIFAPKLYFWADPANAGDKIVQLETSLSLPNVPVPSWIRWLIYWRGLAGDPTYAALNKWSRLEDETKSWKYSSALEKLSGPGIVAYFFTITFCSVDYLMSLDVTWASTIYGFLVAAGQGLSAMSLVVAKFVLILLGKYAPLMDHAITVPALCTILGKLMLALVMMWAYLSFLAVPDYLFG